MNQTAVDLTTMSLESLSDIDLVDVGLVYLVTSGNHMTACGLCGYLIWLVLI